MKLYYKILFLFFVFNKLAAQITVSHPLNNAVYQRNSSSQANLVISGTYSQPLATSIQARLLNPSNDNVIPGFDWSIIQENPSMGYFQGQLNNVPAGWYKLEIRGVRTGTVLEAQNVNRVGIGDVFMIAGQSNAQGYINTGGFGLGSSTEKVVTHDNGMYCGNTVIPFPVLTQLLTSTKPGTAGRDAWCYGRLGDHIVDLTGFPVAFFNSGASGASSENWKVSSDGGATNNPFTKEQFCSSYEENEGRSYSVGMPYSNFKRGLNYYNSMFGARSILWHQGESDKYLGVSAAIYQSNLTYVIDKSRADFASNLPWVLARASYTDNDSSSVITGAQTNLVNRNQQIFPGPYTDQINNFNLPTYSGSRDGINLHFTNPVGLTFLANEWSNYLNLNFFNDSNPISANSPPNISVNYISSTQVTLSVPVGYSSYKWVSVNFDYGSTSYGSSNTLTASSGTYRCWVATANGNQQISSEVNVGQALSLASNALAGNCTENTYVSDLKFVLATNSLGPIEINKTNGSGGDGDGSSIVLKGQSYAKGLGVAENSEIKYIIPSSQYSKFKAKIGISDDVSNACDNTGGVVFKVYGNETLLYTSPTIYRNSALQEIDINVFSYSSLKLVVQPVNANSTCNRAVWADARLLCSFIDNVPPTEITNLVATDTLTKCISFQWTPATDDQLLQGYYIYKDGVKVATIPANQNTYTLSYLNPITSVQFGVVAYDAKGNESAMVSKTLSTVVMNFEYLELNSQICINRSYLPSVLIPKGGTFSQYSGPSATLNTSTGEFFTTNVNAIFIVEYTVGASVPGCEDLAQTQFAAISPPTITPGITADKNLINKGTTVNFTSTACDVNSTIKWSFTASNSATVQYSPNLTDSYFAYCAKYQCYVYSNNVTVNVLSDCSSNLVLAPVANDLGSRINALKFNSSNTITANNTMVPTNNVEYNAANSILLSPGFKVDSGVNFSAKIKNCPN